MRTLNLGVLAHVDAGKTSLTERLLFTAGVIGEVGSVDAGTTRTDTLELERRRGITIRSAVVSFVVDDVLVNLVDTPGHPDFIAEVERALAVLDGIVLVVSAVEGVQAQTRVLMRVAQRLRLPTVLFVNKVDRAGARYETVLAELGARLSAAVVAMAGVEGLGTRSASVTPYGEDDAVHAARLLELLAERDEALLASYVDAISVSYPHLRSALARQTANAVVHPVLFGSALTGAGVDVLLAGIPTLLPAAVPEAEGPLSGSVFKVERGPAGEKVAYVAMRRGVLRVRDRLPSPANGPSRVTAIEVSEPGGFVARPTLRAGQVGRVWGLAGARIGDPIGTRPGSAAARQFAPPTLESSVVPAPGADARSLHAALTALAEQDPLIALRRDDVRGQTLVSLYGEVQKEVLQATLAEEHGLDVTFTQSTTICIERLVGPGEAVEVMGDATNPFLATVGLRVEPAAPGAGVTFGLHVELGSMPLAFFSAVEASVRATLREGLRGWDVPDCTVMMTRSRYAPRQSAMHARFDKSVSSTGADFRGLTPLVLVEALRRAGTVVHEPVHRLTLEIPADSYPAVVPALGRFVASTGPPEARGSSYVVRGVVPAAAVHELQQTLPALTRGEALLETAFDSYRPVVGGPPSRLRTDANPLDREEYLLRTLRRVPAARPGPQ